MNEGIESSLPEGSSLDEVQPALGHDEQESGVFPEAQELESPSPESLPSIGESSSRIPRRGFDWGDSESWGEEDEGGSPRSPSWALSASNSLFPGLSGNIAYSLLLVWFIVVVVLSVPFTGHTQENDAAASSDQAAEQPAADAGSDAPAASSGEGTASTGENPPPAEGDPAASSGEGEASAASGDGAPEDSSTEEGAEAATSPADELAETVRSLIDAGKCEEAIGKCEEATEAIASSDTLLENYVEAMAKASKPNWASLQSKAEELVERKGQSPLTDYALGRAFAEKPKPDLAKALQHLARAKAVKRAPAPGIAMLYYKVMVMVYWKFLAGGAGGLLLLLIVLKKRRKAPPLQEIFIEGLSPAEGAPNAAAAPTAGAPPIPAPGAPSVAPSPASGGQPTPYQLPPRPTPIPPAGQGAAGASPQKPLPPSPLPQSAPGTQAAQLPPRPTPVPPTLPPKPLPNQATQVQTIPQPAVQAPPPQTAAVHPQPQPQTSQPSPDSQGSQLDGAMANLDLAEVAKFQAMVEMPARPNLPPRIDLDEVWKTLTKKAMGAPMGRDFRDGHGAEGVPIKGGQGSPGGRAGAKHGVSERSGPGGSSGEPTVTVTKGPVDLSDATIDLSPGALKDNLVEKMKMLAITDGELRALLLQRNPDHIPDVIEYILTKPEPVRLAFLAREIGNYRDPAISDVLSSLLFHEDQRVVLAAIQGLQMNGGKEAVLLVCPFLQSNVPVLGEAAKAALSSFGPQRILEAMMDLPRSPDDRIRESGVFLLSRMKGTGVIQVLCEMLFDKSQAIRRQVMLAMAHQKDPVFLQLLRDFFRRATDEEDKKMARKAIVYLQNFVPPARTA